MGYSGQSLVPLFDRRSVARVCRELADEGGRSMTHWTKVNTPVGHKGQFSDEGYIPGALRASITQKVVVVTVTLRGLVYESGAETHIEYGPYVENGTGLWGPRRAMYEIRPKNPNGWLRFVDGKTGELVFAKRVMHPGSPGNHMFAIGASMSEHEFHTTSKRIIERWAREQEIHVHVQGVRVS